MMKQNKKGWVAKDFVIALVIFSAGIALLFVMIQSMAIEYENESIIDPTFNNSFNQFDATTSKAQGMLEALTSGNGLSLVDATELIFTGTFTIINLVLGSISIAGTQIANFGTYFGVPTEISQIFSVFLLVVITLSIVFIIINSVKSGKEL